MKWGDVIAEESYRKLYEMERERSEELRSELIRKEKEIETLKRMLKKLEKKL